MHILPMQAMCRQAVHMRSTALLYSSSRSALRPCNPPRQRPAICTSHQSMRDRRAVATARVWRAATALRASHVPVTMDSMAKRASTRVCEGQRRSSMRRGCSCVLGTRTSTLVAQSTSAPVTRPWWVFYVAATASAPDPRVASATLALQGIIASCHAIETTTACRAAGTANALVIPT